VLTNIVNDAAGEQFSGVLNTNTNS